MPEKRPLNRCLDCKFEWMPVGRARDPECPQCKSRNTEIVRTRTPLGASAPRSGCPLGLIFIAVILAAATLWMLSSRGFIKISDYLNWGGTPSTPRTDVESLKPSATPEASEGTSQVAKLTPTPPPADRKPLGTPTPVAEKRALFPAVKPSDLERARASYAKGDFPGAMRSVEGCERSEVEDSDTTQAARSLSKRSRIFAAMTGKIQKNALATATKLEQVTLDTGGTFVGKVLSETDESLKILAPGVEVTVSTEKVATRKTVDRSVLEDKLRSRLQERERGLKPDRAGGFFSLAYYCWQYGLQPDAVPYLDKAVYIDDFPSLIRVFGGNDADGLVQTWCELTGKPDPSTQKQPPLPSDPTAKVASSKDPSTPLPTKPPVASGDAQERMKRARANYEEGVKYYRDSFGDSREAIDNLHRAHASFREALADLETVPDGTPGLEKLLTQAQMLLADVRKRWR